MNKKQQLNRLHLRNDFTWSGETFGTSILHMWKLDWLRVQPYHALHTNPTNYQQSINLQLKLINCNFEPMKIVLFGKHTHTQTVTTGTLYVFCKWSTFVANQKCQTTINKQCNPWHDGLLSKSCNWLFSCFFSLAIKHCQNTPYHHRWLDYNKCYRVISSVKWLVRLTPMGFGIPI